MVGVLGLTVSDRVRIKATTTGLHAWSAHAYAPDSCQGRTANGVRTQERGAFPRTSSTEHKDEARKPDEQGSDSNDAAEDQFGREGDVTLNGRVAHEVHGSCPFDFSVAVDEQRVACAACKH